MKKYILSICLVLSCFTHPSFSQLIAIKAGQVAYPESGTTQKDQTILVENGKIKSIGKNIPIPAAARQIDLSESTVLPGLFDAHTHLCMTVRLKRDNGRYYYTTLNDPDVQRAIDGVVNAKAMLEAGFTTVRDLGAEGRYAGTYVRKAIEAGRIPGPTFINAGRIIAPFGAQFQLQPDKPYLAEPEYYIADTRDEMVKAIRENIHFGAKVIKIVVDDQDYIYSVEDIRFMKEEAAKAGRRLAAHVGTAAGAHNAILAGVASLEHASRITDEDLALAKQKDIVIVFTPFPKWIREESGGNPDVVQAAYRRTIDRIKRAHEIGVSIAFATDALFETEGYTRGTISLSWIDSYVDAGMPDKEILKTMTTNAARLFDVAEERGFIRPGLAADLIATPENPLENIQTLKEVHFVMKDGRIVKQR